MTPEQTEKTTKVLDKVKSLLTLYDRQLKKAAYVIKCFEEWYSETGCPLTETVEGFCPDREELEAEHNEEMKGLPESEKYDIDLQERCGHLYSAGYCYARYYEWKFDQKAEK